MKRLDLVQYRRGSLTTDTVEALRHLEMRAAKIKDMELRLHVSAVARPDMLYTQLEASPGPTGLPPALSAVPTGREIYLRIEFLKDPGDVGDRPQRELAVLWGLAVPLGFVPWARFPVFVRDGDTSTVFHYPGPWQPMMDALMGMGRGEEAWPSFCAAAQSDVGMWGGSRSIERFVQAQLHRLGYNCGPVDGLIGDKTEAALRGSGFSGVPLKDLATKLQEKETPVAPQAGKKVEGHVIVPSGNFSIASYGQVHTIKTSQGAALDIHGPGRVVLDFRGS